MCQDDANVWIFEYGSLIWRPGFNYVRKITGYVKGFQRRFFQKCRFHRGTNDKPGRVVTILQSDNLEDKVYGICYCVTIEDSYEILKMLDFREQGGYIRK